MAVNSSKSWLLIGGAVIVAVILVGFFVFNPPGDDGASGAIGAVEKYRADQISEDDVVLGGAQPDSVEIPFADLLDDAAALESVSAQLEAFSRDLGNFSALGQKNLSAQLEAINRTLESHSLRLGQRSLSTWQAQANSLNTALGARGAGIDADSLNAFRSQLEAFSQSLGAKAAAFDAQRYTNLQQQLGAMSRDLGAFTSLNARSFNAARDQLDAFSAQLENRSFQFDQPAAMNLGDHLSKLEASLGARELTLAHRRLDAGGSWLGAMSLQARSVASLRDELQGTLNKLGAFDQLGAKDFAAMQKTLGAFATDLGSRAIEVQNTALSGFNKQLGAFSLEQKMMADLGAKLNAFDSALGARAAGLEAKTLSGLQSRIGALDKQLGAFSLSAMNRLDSNLRVQLGAFNRVLDNKSFQLGAMSLDNFKAHLGSLSSTLDARAQAFDAQAATNFQAQLGALSRTLDARVSGM